MKPIISNVLSTIVLISPVIAFCMIFLPLENLFSNALLIDFYKRYTVALIGGLWIIIDTCLTLFCKRYTDNKRAFHICVIGLFIYLGLFLLLLFLLMIGGSA